MSELMQLTPDQRKSLSEACFSISNSLGQRMKPLSESNRLGDIYEILTAVVYLMSSPSNIRYVTRDERIKSFITGRWEYLGRVQTVEDMVESGFFYLNELDHVKCFFCDLGLKDWDHADNPEREHAKFSPLCFFLKCSRGLTSLRNLIDKPPNYPISYTKQDHNQLMKIICEEFTTQHSDIVCKLGFNETKVILCIARKFIRFRQKYDRTELLNEMQKEWDREIRPLTETPYFICSYDIASVCRVFYERICPNRDLYPSEEEAGHFVVDTATAALRSKCKICKDKTPEIVCLPCGHLSMCLECSRNTKICPVASCRKAVSSFVRAFVP